MVESKFVESEFVEISLFKIDSKIVEKGWLKIGRIFLVERSEVEPFDQIAGIEWNVVEFYRICCMARSLRSLRQVATLRHAIWHVAPLRFAPAFRALGICEHVLIRHKKFDPSCFDPFQKFGMLT